MPVFAVSAVDTTANTLTATGVAASGGALGTVLQTGDRLRLRNVGGALPAATPSLAPVTDYFAIRVDDDHIKLAVTNADAMAGTAIDITGSGSGTTTIEFNLPYCVPRIDAGGTQVFSRDNNATWGSLVALYSLLVGQAQAIWTTITFAVGLVMGANQNITLSGTGDLKHGDRVLSFSGTMFVAQSGTVTFQLSGGITSAASCILLGDIPLRIGDRIKAITVTFDSVTGTVDVTDFHVDRITANGTATSLGSTTVSNIGAPTTTTIDLTDTTLATNESFLITIAINATGCTTRNVNVTYDRP